MAKDVLITPLDGEIQFSSSAGVPTGQIKVDGDDLVISNLVGDVLLGDGTSDIFIGDGASNVDIVFEQNGEIRDDGSGKNITLGSKTTNVFITSSTVVMQKDSGNVGIGTTSPSSTLEVVGDLKTSSHITSSGNISSSGIISTNTLENVSNINYSAGSAVHGDIDLSDATIQLRATNDGSQGLKLFGGTNGAASPHIDTDSFTQLLLKVDGTQVVNLKSSLFSVTGNITSSNNISASDTIITDKFKANLEAGVDNSVLIKDADGFIKTDEIDDRVWSGGQLLSGDGGPLTDNYIPYVSDGGSGLLDSSNLRWESNKLGIGVGSITPPKTLTVEGDISASGDLFVNNITASAGNFSSHITASGNISSSGTITANSASLSGKIDVAGRSKFGLTGNAQASHHFKGISGDTNFFLVFDKDGEEIMKGSGDIGGGDLLYQFGDIGAAGNGTVYRVDDGNNRHVLRSDSDNTKVGINKLVPTTELEVAGDISASGEYLGNQIQIYNANFQDDLGTSIHYVPIGTNNFEQITEDADEVGFVAPYDGELVKIIYRHNFDASSTTTRWTYTIFPDGTDLAGSPTSRFRATITGATTDDIKEVTVADADGALNDMSFNKGETIFLSINNGADVTTTAAEFHVTVVLKFKIPSGLI